MWKLCGHPGGKRDERLEAQTCKEVAQWSRRRCESLGHSALAQAGAQTAREKALRVKYRQPKLGTVMSV